MAVLLPVAERDPSEPLTLFLPQRLKGWLKRPSGCSRSRGAALEEDDPLVRSIAFTTDEGHDREETPLRSPHCWMVAARRYVFAARA